MSSFSRDLRSLEGRGPWKGQPITTLWQEGHTLVGKLESAGRPMTARPPWQAQVYFFTNRRTKMEL
jgi:hypothetical protein